MNEIAKTINKLEEDIKKVLGVSPYQWQTEAIKSFVSDKNVVIVAPTSAGKSLPAYASLWLLNGGAIVSPSVALTIQHYGNLKSITKDVYLGVRGYPVTKDAFQSSFYAITYYRLQLFLARLRKKISEVIKTIVVDEIHSIGQEMDLLLTLIRRIFPDIKIMGLSATVLQRDQLVLSKWLNARIINIRGRPVPMDIYVVYFKTNLLDEFEMIVLDSDANVVDKRKIQKFPFRNRYEHILMIEEWVKEFLGKNNPQIMYFFPTRNRATNFVKKIMKNFSVNPELEKEAEKIPEHGINKVVKSALKRGLILHHGDVPVVTTRKLHRIIKEKPNDIRRIVTCYTLAQGVNLPMEVLILDGVYDYNKKILDTTKFWQLAGRVGRKGYHSRGIVIIPVFTKYELTKAYTDLINKEASEMRTTGFNKNVISRFTLQLVAFGINSPEQMASFFKETFYVRKFDDPKPFVRQVAKQVQELIKMGYVRVNNGKLELTKAGNEAAMFFLSAEEHRIIKNAIEKKKPYETVIKELAEYTFDNMDIDPVYRDNYVEKLVKFGFLIHSFWNPPDVKRGADAVRSLLEVGTQLALEFYGENSEEHRYAEKILSDFTMGRMKVAWQLKGLGFSITEISRVVRELARSLRAYGVKKLEELGKEENREILDILLEVLFAYTQTVDFDKVEKLAKKVGVDRDTLVKMIMKKRGELQ